MKETLIEAHNLLQSAIHYIETADYKNSISLATNAAIKMIGQKKTLLVPEQGIEKGSFFIELPKSEVKGHKNKVVIEVYSGERLIDRVKTNFVGPIK